MRRHAGSIAATLTGAVATGLLLFGPMPDADAAGWVQPYGGCKEAAGYVDSSGAKSCREHGWIIRKRIVVSPSGRVWNRLPVCERTVAHRHCFVPFTPSGAVEAAYIVDTYGPHITRTTRITR